MCSQKSIFSFEISPSKDKIENQLETIKLSVFSHFSLISKSIARDAMANWLKFDLYMLQNSLPFHFKRIFLPFFCFSNARCVLGENKKKTNYVLYAPFIHIRWLVLGIAKHVVISKLLNIFAFPSIEALINVICNYIGIAWWFIVYFSTTDTVMVAPKTSNPTSL